MSLRLWLAVAMLAVVTPALAEQQVTPGQIEDLKEEIADIDEWLADAEEDRSSLEQQLSGLERDIGRLTRERRELRQQAREQQLRLTELGKEETELTRVLESQRDSLKKQIRAAWMEGDAPAVKVLLNEIDPDKISSCIRHGVNVMEQNLDESLDNFEDNSFDTVVMTQSLQAMHYPDRVLEDMLRIGHEGILTFPNFAHWRCRWYLGTKGRMPVSEFMPYTWYNTPNIHFCTFKDFEQLCRERGIKVLDRLVVDQTHQSSWFSGLWPNLLGEVAIYRVSR